MTAGDLIFKRPATGDANLRWFAAWADAQPAGTIVSWKTFNDVEYDPNVIQRLLKLATERGVLRCIRKATIGRRALAAVFEVLDYKSERTMAHHDSRNVDRT